MPLVTITVSHIIAGRRTFTQVPAAILSDVEADLFSLGFGTDGKLL
ncbi:CD1375 family protein [Paenibacillus sp. NRS-1760]